MRKKPGSIILAIMAAVLLLTGCGQEKAETQRQQSNSGETSELKVTFFDVGKGDAILLETDTQSMLIDTGYDDTSDVILDYLEEENIEKLDYLIITHFDKDHVGGADKILEHVEAEEVLEPDYESDSGQTEEYKEALKKKGITPVKVTDTMELDLKGTECTVYPPRQKEYEEEDNDFSLVVSLRFGEEGFLFAGDCEKERISELMAETDLDLRHQVLKVPHHGRAEKNSDKFLLAVRPEAAVITCSEDKEPDKELLELLSQLNSEIYLTMDGTVTCVSDGESLHFSQQKPESLQQKDGV